MKVSTWWIALTVLLDVALAAGAVADGSDTFVVRQDPAMASAIRDVPGEVTLKADQRLFPSLLADQSNSPGEHFIVDVRQLTSCEATLAARLGVRGGLYPPYYPTNDVSRALEFAGWLVARSHIHRGAGSANYRAMAVQSSSLIKGSSALLPRESPVLLDVDVGQNADSTVMLAWRSDGSSASLLCNRDDTHCYMHANFARGGIEVSVRREVAGSVTELTCIMDAFAFVIDNSFVRFGE